MALLLHSCTCRVLWLMMRPVSLTVYVCILLNEKGREGKKENYRQIDNSSLRVLFLLFFSFSSSSFSSLLCSHCCSLSLQFTVNEEREHFRCCCCFHYSNWIRTEYRQTDTAEYSEWATETDNPCVQSVWKLCCCCMFCDSLCLLSCKL